MKQNQNHKDALKWVDEHGGDFVLAKGAKGGRLYLACGESGPFMPVTVKALIDMGHLEEYKSGSATRYRRIK